jgi:mono/diheme cytochrome c family protein
MPRPSICVLLGLALPVAASAAGVDFATQIRPIFNQNCTSCHGGVKAAGDISFVYQEALTKVGKKSGHQVVVPGNPDASELIARVSSTDKEYRMPPAEHGPALPPDKIALLRQWIKEGAPWQDHWAFVPPKQQHVPPLKDSALMAWAASPIDHFVAARLEQEKLRPAPAASRPAWLRRVSLDLTGIPPTPEETAAFVADSQPRAFERQTDRLLASPRFGERWASLWLDLARYADTKGYEKDENRNVWQYRDWLIGAFNRNLPYDRFVIEQLAGDLLPNATLDQLIATSFHRQTQVNDEGGTDDEEYRIAAVIDRVATTWQVTNGVTFGCVQCHSHPYDPIKHEEFYRFYAYFNETRDADFNNEYPTLRIPTDAARAADILRLQREVDTLRHEVVSAGRKVEADAAQWQPAPVLAVSSAPAADVTVHDGTVHAEGTVAAAARFDLTLPVFALSSEPLTALRFDALPVDSEKARHTPERGFIITQIQIALNRPDGTVTPLEVGRFFPDTENFTVTAMRAAPKPVSPADQTKSSAPAKKKTGTIAANDAVSSSAPAIAAPAERPKVGKKAAGKAGKNASKGATAAMPAEEGRDITLDFHFAANPTISGRRWVVAALREPLVAPPGSTISVSIVHGRGITEKPAPVRRLQVAASADARWTGLARDQELVRKSARVTAALGELARIPGTDLPVMSEMPPEERRETRRFVRGNFLEKTGEPLAPGVPGLFPPLPADAPRNRLTLAKWFFQPGQPLTGRVAVNRFWEQLFGVGIVATLEDFGSAGDRPTHPELLDWLALHFERDLHWNTKALLRELVLSATYRQDGKASPELLERDPQNRLLARGPRQRLTAEMVRDQAMAASGLLSAKMGGAPVMPPQPAGVWQTVYNSKDWVTSPGDDRYRRAVYTFWKRSAAYPGFLSFDMPARDLCTVRRTPTNTPLQALVTLNDEVYHEAARALAARVDRELADAPIGARIDRAFELVIARSPTPAESARLLKLFQEASAASAAVTVASAETAGAAAPAPDLVRARAMQDVAAAVLNLDAAFVR